MAINHKKNKGFTIFFAMLVGGLALSIGMAIYDLTVREIDLSATATQSQYAIYAADTGVECALYWDFKCSLGPCTANGNTNSAFATSSYTATPVSGATCNGVDIAATGSSVESFTAATTTFTLTFLPQKYCTTVEVAKSGNPSQTVITSRGFNTCSVGGLGRLERVLEIRY
jgi:hypothetical protein